MLKPLEIGSDVPITKDERKAEQDMRYMSNAICAAGKSLAYVLEYLVTAKNQCLASSPEDDGKLVLEAQEEGEEDFCFDFPKAVDLVINALKLLGMANVQTGQNRRAKLAAKFKPEYKKLCSRGNNFPDGKFFGPNFNTAVALVTNKNRVSSQALKDGKPRQQGFHGFKCKRSDNCLSTSQLQNAVLQQALQMSSGQPQQQTQPFLGQTMGDYFPPPKPAPQLPLPILQRKSTWKRMRKGPLKGKGRAPQVDATPSSLSTA